MNATSTMSNREPHEPREREQGATNWRQNTPFVYFEHFAVSTAPSRLCVLRALFWLTCLAAGFTATAQTFTTLKRFTGSDGRNPNASLTLSGSTLYGTVFRIDLSIPLVMETLGDAVVLSWSDPSFALQAAPSATGTYTNIAGATSPHTNAIAGPQQFFRLMGN